MEPTADDLAAWLNVAPHPEMVTAVAAAIDWARKRRCLTRSEQDMWTESVRLGTLIYAGVLWQRRAAPQGFDGYDMAATVQGYTVADAWGLVPVDPVTA